MKVMISSTARDLPLHRKEVMDACIRQDMFPSMMEHLPALDAEAIEASLTMVDEVDIYLGVFAHRYGYIPKDNNPQQLSVTEMEYNRAVERGIPRFIFLMHDQHKLKASDVEKGIGGEKLDALKARLGTDRVANFFKNPEDLRAHVIDTLARYKQKQNQAANSDDGALSAGSTSAGAIPVAPETYIAHPYTLLQTHKLVGRRAGLNLLTDWVIKSDAEVHRAHILSVTAIGGMGKSALTWKWFNDIAPEEMKPLAGRVWWSFYESEASFENFVIRALAYVSRRTIEEVRQIPAPDREASLLAVLNREPYLIVLDGLERLLIAYARGDAARLKDSEVESDQHVRKTSDPRVGQFLRKLAGIKCSRILISTRLFPAELETAGGEPLPGVFNRKLEGLTEGDAVELWRAFGVSGARDELQPVFDAIERHPLLIQALAGEVKRYKRAPGDFAVWRGANPRFNPVFYPQVKDAMAHVMEFALGELAEQTRRVLEVISAFRMPTDYATLAAILTEGEKLCDNEMELDAALVELEDRGLAGWDRRANRYDLHPIVRGVVWEGLGGDERAGIYTRLHTHFEAVPNIEFEKVESLEDLTPAIELYHALIEIGRYDDAFRLFYDRLDDALLYRLSASLKRVELLELLFPDGLNQLPRLRKPGDQADTLDSLATGYSFSGQPERAIQLYRRHNIVYSEMNDDKNFCIGLCNLSEPVRLTGALLESEAAARRALAISRKGRDGFQESISLRLFGLALAARGESTTSAAALQRSLNIAIEFSEQQSEGVVCGSLAQRGIWFGEYAEALTLADRAWELAKIQRLEADFIRAARVQGKAALGLNDLTRTDERLHHALSRARAVNLVEEELPALIALTELRRRQDDPTTGRELLDDVWEFAERGPYRLFHADALNVLAQIERDAGNLDKAIEAATKSYRLSWCDGPPYAYHWGLVKAEKHLRELGVDPPEMPAFDESKFEPMPEVEIDPEDEFHVGAGSTEGPW